MTDDAVKKTQPKPSQKDKKGKKPKIKRVRQLGVFSYIFLFLITMFLLILTPLYGFVLSLVPEYFKELIIEDYYKSATLSADGKTLSAPLKYQPDVSLPVLGNETGVCFMFHSTMANADNNSIDAKRLDKAKRGKRIAEIIVIGEDTYEYNLSITTLNETADKDGNAISSICQKFGNSYPTFPEEIDTVYIRPLQPFTPIKVTWESVRTVHVD
tara:strand:+ start:3276 stop:3914 length:639 start_codon:yes stop_codon:yes gene_type:complete